MGQTQRSEPARPPQLSCTVPRSWPPHTCVYPRTLPGGSEPGWGLRTAALSSSGPQETALVSCVPTPEGGWNPQSPWGPQNTGGGAHGSGRLCNHTNAGRPGLAPFCRCHNFYKLKVRPPSIRPFCRHHLPSRICSLRVCHIVVILTVVWTSSFCCGDLWSGIFGVLS